MKTTFQLEINASSKKIFFPEERIKDKYKIIEILLEACRYILYNKIEEKARAQDKIILKKDKTNRLIFVCSNKIYSIAFPFNIYYDNENIKINYKNILDINSYTISTLLGLIKSPMLNSHSCLDFIEPVIELEEQDKLSYWIILKDLLMLEDGYIRYDKDEIGFLKAKEKKEEKKHPLHHIDIFYTSQVSFKLGLLKEFTEVELIDILDINTNCKFLQK